MLYVRVKSSIHGNDYMRKGEETLKMVSVAVV